jgi:hypothetical protein
MPALSQLAQHVRIKTVLNGVAPSPEFTPEHRPYKVTLTYQGRKLTVPFYMGPALEHDPTTVDVLDCLLSDAAGYENATDLDDWAAEYGYNLDEPPDRAHTRRIYRQVERQTEKLRSFLGDDYQMFLYAERD